MCVCVSSPPFPPVTCALVLWVAPLQLRCISFDGLAKANHCRFLSFSFLCCFFFPSSPVVHVTFSSRSRFSSFRSGLVFFPLLFPVYFAHHASPSPLLPEMKKKTKKKINQIPRVRPEHPPPAHYLVHPFVCSLVLVSHEPLSFFLWGRGGWVGVCLLQSRRLQLKRPARKRGNGRIGGKRPAFFFFKHPTPTCTEYHHSRRNPLRIDAHQSRKVKKPVVDMDVDFHFPHRNRSHHSTSSDLLGVSSVACAMRDKKGTREGSTWQ